jgi:hypothetical protein
VVVRLEVGHLGEGELTLAYFNMKKKLNSADKLIMTCATLYVGTSILNSFNGNKKGLIGNLIGAFIAVFIAVSLMPMVSQEINNAINCNSTYNASYETPTGPTDSFGGAGADVHFGGYTGEVKHDSWGSQYALVKTNESLILNPNCQEMTGMSQTILGIVPSFFVLIIFGFVMNIILRSFRDLGFV